MSESACHRCIYWQENEVGKQECQFPWFDPTPEDILKKACALEDNMDGELEY